LSANLFLKQWYSQQPSPVEEREWYRRLYLTPTEYLESIRNIRAERLDFVAGSLDNVPSDFIPWAVFPNVILDEHLPDADLQEEIKALVTGP